MLKLYKVNEVTVELILKHPTLAEYWSKSETEREKMFRIDISDDGRKICKEIAERWANL